MKNTNNYNLPLFESGDKFNKETINETNAKIDLAISDLQETFSASATGGALTTQEVVNARKGKESLKDKIDEIDVVTQNNKTQLDNNVQQIRELNSCPQNYDGAVFSFIDDDGGYYITDIWKPIIAEKNIKMGFAIVTGNVGKVLEPTNPYRSLTLEQIKQLQSEGHDIYSHTKTHYDTQRTEPDVLDAEFKESKEWLISNGFNECADVLVYPGGLPLNDVVRKNVTRKYYKYGVTTIGGYTPSPFDNWAVYRVNADTMTLDQLKVEVDKAIANNGWLIFMNHAFELNKDKTNQMQKIKDLIDYIKGLNKPILKFSEAEKLKGNAIAIGEFTELGTGFVDKKGYGRSGIICYNDGNFTRDLYYYKKGHITKENIPYTQDTLFNRGGILETFRHPKDDSYSYQKFKPFLKNLEYYREWNSTTKVWSIFDIPSPISIYTLIAGQDINLPLTSFKSNCVTVSRINYAQDTFKSKGGILTTYRLDEDTTAYQTYQIANENKIFIRKWDNTNLVWKTWGVVGGYNFETTANNGSILNNVLTDFIQNSVTEYIVQTNASNPEGKGGLYKVYRYADDSYSYSEFKIWNSNVLYRRRWNGTAWTTWEKVSVV